MIKHMRGESIWEDTFSFEKEVSNNIYIYIYREREKGGARERGEREREMWANN
jgi:hypothetical protein